MGPSSPGHRGFSEAGGGIKICMQLRMLETIAIILIILWLLGWLAFPVGGNLIHLLLVVILIVILIRVFQGRRPVP